MLGTLPDASTKAPGTDGFHALFFPKHLGYYWVRCGGYGEEMVEGFT